MPDIKDKVHPSVFADLDRLRLSPDAVATAPEALSTVVPRKTRPNEFFRVHPANSILTTTYVDKPSNDVYLVVPEVRSLLAAEMKPMALLQAKTRQGVDIVLPVPATSGDGRANTWHESYRSAVSLAKGSWVRMAADMHLGAYRVYQAQGELGEPEWPDMPFEQLLETAFRGRVIDSEDHPIIRKLRGLE